MNFLGLTVKAIAASLDGIREVNHMAKKEILDKLSIYIPQKKMEEHPVERLIRRPADRLRSLLRYLYTERGSKRCQDASRAGGICLWRCQTSRAY